MHRDLTDSQMVHAAEMECVSTPFLALRDVIREEPRASSYVPSLLAARNGVHCDTVIYK